MPGFERICPQCGASNSINRTRCVKCRAPLMGAPAASATPEAPLSRGAMTRLAWTATKFFARIGFNLARSGVKRGVERVQHRSGANVRNETVEGEYAVVDEISDEGLNASPALTGWRGLPSPNPEPKDSGGLSWGPKK
jgi:hypothetical protein